MKQQNLGEYISLLWPEAENNANVTDSVDIDVNVLKDLGMDYIFMRILGGSNDTGSAENADNNLHKYITDDPEVISYRLDAIDDLMSSPELIKCFEEILPYITDLKENIHGAGRINAVDKNLADVLSRMSELQVYVECVNRLNSTMNGKKEEYKQEYKSQGLKWLYKKISGIANSDSFKSLAEELSKVKDESRKLSSVTIGVNLDEQLKPAEAVLVSVNNEKYSSGSLIDKLTNLEFKANKFTGISRLQVIDNSLAAGAGRNLIFRQSIINSLNSILKSVVKPVIPVIEKYEELMKGSIDILLLSQIANKDMYGFEIVKSLQAKSNNLYKMSEGTLYPALQRLEHKKYLESYWGDSETGGRRKYYKITEQGKKELLKKIEEWNKVNELINSCKEEGFVWTNSEITLAQS